jgi:hypothetical protein
VFGECCLHCRTLGPRARAGRIGRRTYRRWPSLRQHARYAASAAVGPPVWCRGMSPGSPETEHISCCITDNATMSLTVSLQQVHRDRWRTESRPAAIGTTRARNRPCSAWPGMAKSRENSSSAARIRGPRPESPGRSDVYRDGGSRWADGAQDQVSGVRVVYWLRFSPTSSSRRGIQSWSSTSPMDSR